MGTEGVQKTEWHPRHDINFYFIYYLYTENRKTFYGGGGFESFQLCVKVVSLFSLHSRSNLLFIDFIKFKICQCLCANLLICVCVCVQKRENVCVYGCRSKYITDDFYNSIFQISIQIAVNLLFIQFCCLKAFLIIYIKQYGVFKTPFFFVHFKASNECQCQIYRNEKFCAAQKTGNWVGFLYLCKIINETKMSKYQ